MQAMWRSLMGVNGMETVLVYVWGLMTCKLCMCMWGDK